MAPAKSEIVIYQTDDGKTRIDVRMENETVWLTQAQMTALFQTTKQNISLHVKNIFAENELSKDSVVKEYLTTAADGKKYRTAFYSLDMIIAVGYRVKSLRGTQFRRWATGVLHEYLAKGFAMNDELLKNMGGGHYWKELLERIRDIRASEKVMYRQILDLYATSLDYDASMPETVAFFKIVQNKLHYAVSGHTAAEIIFDRANAELPFMGLTVFKGSRPVKSEVTVAKNYMTEKELFALRRMVNAFFDMAELKAETHQPMYMKDWLETLDTFSQNFGMGILEDAGSVSHSDAVDKAHREYDAYRAQLADELSDVEKAYLDTLKQMQKQLKNGDAV
ncbi:virulence RhuM family protein [Desulfovibrio sp. OttesenSCG-928-G11]|nr:virulence RhuM family protein [Desulfovibrio sp. OttesenSCG-928-G11]